MLMKCMVQEAKFPVKNLVHIYIYIYIYDIKFLALLGAPYTHDISRPRVNKGHLHTLFLEKRTVYLENPNILIHSFKRYRCTP
jgi:hypothetical protein